jgi:5-methylcytosine-specific restriction endonuclease McrA
MVAKKPSRLKPVLTDVRKHSEIEAAWLLHTTPEERLQSQLRRIWLDRHLVNQKGRCAYCNVLMSVDSSLARQDCSATIDHVIASSRGGDDLEENTVAACAACNTAKADLSKDEFEVHAVRLQRLLQANTPPDRLAADPKSPFYDDDAMSRGVAVRFRGRERDDVEEYCRSEGWVKIPAGKAVDRRGRPITVKLSGAVDAYFSDLYS